MDTNCMHERAKLERRNLWEFLSITCINRSEVIGTQVWRTANPEPLVATQSYDPASGPEECITHEHPCSMSKHVH